MASIPKRINAHVLLIDVKVHLALAASVLFLLCKNFIFSCRNRDDHTPLDVAASEGHAKVVELLIRTISESHPAKFLNKLVNPHSQTSKSQKRTSKSNEPKEMERPKINDTVAEKDSQQATDVPEENVDSPLHLAITHDHLEVVKVLIKKEADVKLPNYKTKKTPLQVAIEEKHE